MYQESANNRGYENRSHSKKRPDQNVRSSSKESIKDLDTATGEAETLKKLKEIGECTRKMLGVATGLESNYYTKYVNNLIKKGLVLESKDKAKCKITGRRVFWIKAANEKSIQTQLF